MTAAHRVTLATVLGAGALLSARPAAADEPAAHRGVYGGVAIVGTLSAGPASAYDATATFGAGGLELALGYFIADDVAVALDAAGEWGSTWNPGTPAYFGRALVLADWFVNPRFDLRLGAGAAGFGAAGTLSPGFPIPGYPPARDWGGLPGAGPALLVGAGVVVAGARGPVGLTVGIDLGADVLFAHGASFVPLQATARVGVVFF